MPGNIYIQEESPSVYRVLVQGIPPQISSLITFQVGAGQAAPPSPIYCRVPVDLAAGAPAAQQLLFLAPPPNADDAARAEEWARSHGIAFLPTIDCTPELLAGGGVGAGNVYVPPGTFAEITSPATGQVLSGVVPIFGTASFDPGQVQFYNVEIVGGIYANWTPVQDPQRGPIVNGQLAALYTPIEPGSYGLRVVFVNNNGETIVGAQINFTVQ